jgi:endonuclease III
MTDSNAKYPKTVRAVARLLQRRYEDFAHYNKRDPYRELIFISCSTLTQETVYRRIYASFVRKFPNMSAASRATVLELRRVLDPGGLGRRKATLLKRLFSTSVERFGVSGLGKLRRLDDQELEDALLDLPGMGKKVARCVMLYSYRRQVFPVDTHCWRMAKRLGWIRGSALTPKMMDRLQEKIPPKLRFSLHVNMVSHGRAVCRARDPRCAACVLEAVCPKIGVAADARRH